MAFGLGQACSLGGKVPAGGGVGADVVGTTLPVLAFAPQPVNITAAVRIATTTVDNLAAGKLIRRRYRIPSDTETSLNADISLDRLADIKLECSYPTWRER